MNRKIALRADGPLNIAELLTRRSRDWRFALALNRGQIAATALA